MMSIPLRALILCGVILLPESAPAAPKTRIYAEDFALEPGQKEGASLERRISAGTGPAWRTDGMPRLTGANSVSVEPPRGGAAWVPLEEEMEPASGSRDLWQWRPKTPAAGIISSLQVRATLDPAGADWTALAIGGEWGARFYDTAQLWVLVRSSSDYQVRAKGQTLILQNGKVPFYNTSGGNVVDLAYDAKANTVSLTLNGQLVLNREPLDPRGFHPTLDSVGFKINGPVDPGLTPSVSAFSVKITGDFQPSLAVSLDDDLPVYPIGGIPEPRVTGRYIEGSSLRLGMRLLDFQGRETWRRTETIAPIGGAFTVLPRLDAPAPGYYQLDCLIQDATGRTIASVRRPFAIIPDPPAVTRTDENPFGAMVYPHIAYPMQDREMDARYMRRIGLHYVRTHRLNWIHIQPAAGAEYNWGDADREAGIWRRNGLRIIATTGWPVPTWASDAKDLALPETKGNFMPSAEAMPEARRFHRELAGRYRDDIAFYEIGNEVDAHFWLGSAAHYLEHDIPGIIRDYRDYFSALSGEIRSVAPGAFVAPNTTGATEGAMYRPWLTTQLDLGLGKAMTAYSTHYSADLDYTEQVMRAHDAEMPVILTEIGGYSRMAEGADPFGSEMRRMIYNDYFQMVTQLSHANVKALCKFIFREQPTYGGEGTIVAGLLGVDFTLRPSYVAYATLVRHLAGAKPVGRINLSGSADSGWAEGFAFERDGQAVNVLFLHAAQGARVRFESRAARLSIVDVMGCVTPLVPAGGRVDLEMSPELPLIVIGQIEGQPGPVVIPKDRLVDEVVLPLANPGFENRAVGETIPGWGLMVNEKGGATKDNKTPFSVLLDRAVHHGGTQSVCMTAQQPTQWYGVSQTLPLDGIPHPGPGEYLVFKVFAQAKGEAIHGKGFGYTLAFRRMNWERLTFMGSPYYGFGGTYDWKELAMENRLDVWPEGAERVTLDLLLGLSTGKLWLDDIKVIVQRWKTP